MIGSSDHAMVYRIAAGGRNFALKVVSISIYNQCYVSLITNHWHKYTTEPYPEQARPNIFFETERAAYSRLFSTGKSPRAPIPICHGYVKLPRPLHERYRCWDTYSASFGSPAAFNTYLVGRVLRHGGRSQGFLAYAEDLRIAI